VEYLGAERALERQQAKDERLRVMAMAVSGSSKRAKRVENHGKMEVLMGKPWENHRKTIGKWRFTLWSCQNSYNLAIEIASFPMKHGDFP
jgi:hypothetical protein